ncbi:MAG: hypothetical protein K2M89_06190 [Clostridiales bacterium]|nr:hypothetical protein [Clostridiales bacterium]
MKRIREWRSDEWETGDKARSQRELQRMARKIITNAEKVENEPTPGHSEVNLGRVLICTSSLLPNTEYIIHMNGFTVEDIIEIIS